MADRAGRPEIKSTFNVLQAFLSAWTEKDGTRFEKIAEEKADEKPIGTFLMTFTLGKGDGYSLIIPEVHPGPFLSVGGSNLPFVLYKAFSRRAMVLHSVSDHALNIPSKKEMDIYLEGLKSAKRLSSHSRCSRPVLVEEGHCGVTGIRFDKVCILILSMSPKGMEDVPYSVLSSLRQYSREKGFDSLLLIDSHNAMGEPLNDQSAAQLVKTGKRCLDELRDSIQFPFLVGYANFVETSVRERFRDDLDGSGLAVLALNIDGEWDNADFNYYASHIQNITAGYTAYARQELESIEITDSNTQTTSTSFELQNSINFDMPGGDSYITTARRISAVGGATSLSSGRLVIIVTNPEDEPVPTPSIIEVKEEQYIFINPFNPITEPLNMIKYIFLLFEEYFYAQKNNN